MTDELVGELIDTVAWVLIVDRRILCARPSGKEIFYIPGGKREAGESDEQTLVREIAEELTVALVAETVEPVGVYEAVDGTARVRMSCYRAEYRGQLTASSEIAEIAWFGYADRPHVPPVDQLLFDELHTAGALH